AAHGRRRAAHGRRGNPRACTEEEELDRERTLLATSRLWRLCSLRALPSRRLLGGQETSLLLPGESTLEDRRGAWAGESTFSSRRAGDLVPFEYFESEPAWFLELCLEALDSDPNELYIQ
ncbi:Hypothetical protein SCF082_LOCUS41127, partial [Durusdinium trenchii]